MIRRIVISVILYTASGAVFPYGWTHRLDQACEWRPKALWGAVAISNPDIEDAHERHACLRRKGLQDFGEGPFILLKRWPSAR